MKYKMLIIISLFAAICLAQVNGIREDLLPNRIKVRVWGNHAERGYAQGYLLAEESVQLFEDYVINSMFMGSIYAYGQMRSFFETNFEVDEEYMTEFAGMLDGIVAAGESIYFETLNREIDAVDIAMVNAVVDILVFARQQGLEVADPWGCATLSSWGDATIDDPLLQGDMIVTRHLDWNSAGILDDYALLLVCQPSETDEQAFISFTYPLFVTALSATNESGLTCFMDVGSDDSIVNNGPYQPVLLRMRQAIEKIDYDGNGECDPQDMVSALSESNVAAAAIITTVKDSETEPLIIEINNSGVSVRTQADNDLLPAIIGDNLVATNHFRVLQPPLYCSRYANLANAIEDNSDFSAQRQWDVLADEAGQGTWTRMTIQINPAQAECLWTSTLNTTPAYNTVQTRIDLYEEFQGWMDIPEYAAKTTVAFLFFNDGNSYEELDILSEMASMNLMWGDNAIKSVVFLNETSPDVIPEYQELRNYFDITQTPHIRYNGNHSGGNSTAEVFGRALDALLPAARLDLQIHRLDTTAETIAYSVENLGIEQNIVYEVAVCYIRDDNVAENWVLIDDLWDIPLMGKRSVYELDLPTPDGGWDGIQVLLSMINYSEMEIMQSALYGSEQNCPIRFTYDGARDIVVYDRETVSLETLTFFNDSDETLTISAAFDVEQIPDVVEATIMITTAEGDETEQQLSEALYFELLSGEYIYLDPILRNLEDNICFDFSLTATYSLIPEIFIEVPFSITMPTDSKPTEIKLNSLISNYPNPFNPETSIEFEMAESGKASVEIYNLKGQKVTTLVSDNYEAGKHTVTWNAAEQTSGIYLLKFTTTLQTKVSKIVLLK